MDLNFWKKDNNDSYNQSHQQVEYQYDAEIKDNLSEVVDSPEYYKPEPPDLEKARFYNNISRWALYVGVFLLPLFFVPSSTSFLELNKQMLLIVVGGVALVSWLLGVVSSGYLSWRLNPLDKGILVLTGAFVVGSVFSVSNFKSIFGAVPSLSNALMSIIPLSIIYFLIVNNTEDKGKKLSSLLGLSLLLVLIYGLLQVFGIHLINYSGIASKAFNTVGSVNSLGIVAAIALPFFAKSRIDLGSIKKLNLEKVGTVASVMVLIVLNWWVLWAVAIGGMVAMIVFENLSGGRFKISKLLLPMTIVVLGVFLTVVNLNLGVLKKDLPVEVAPSFRLSKDVIAASFKENMLFGYGMENFSIAFDKYGSSRLSNTTLADARFLDATSEIITLSVHGGLVMVLAIVFLLFCLGMVFWKFKNYASEDPESAKANTGILASMIALFVAMFLYPFNLTLMALLYVFMGLTILVVFDKNKKEFNIEEKASLSLVSSLGFIGGLILVLVGVYFGATIYISDVKYAQALEEKDNNKATELVVEAINWNSQDDRYYRLSSQIALKLIDAELDKKADNDRNTKIQNYTSTSISLAKRATEVNPKEAQNWANLGFIYQNLLPVVDGVDKLSEDAYLKAADLRPGDASFYHRIGMLYLGKFDLLSQLVATRRADPAKARPLALDAIKKSEQNLKKAIEISPNFGAAIYNLGAVYDRQGELSEAIVELEKIVPYNSNQPNLAFELGLLYYRVGRKDEAFSQLQRAVVLSPDYANALWYLSLLYEERKDVDNAILSLEKILSNELNKDNKMVNTKLEQLRAGQVTIPPEKVTDRQPIQ